MNREKANLSARKYRFRNREKILKDQATLRAKRLVNVGTLWKRENPESAKVMERKRRLKGRYGITPHEFDVLVAEQGGVCAICEQLPSGRGKGNVLQVDHDHATGKIRALLCGVCNLAVGKLEDGLTAKRLAYLARWPQK